MKSFKCQCSNIVFFENTRCVACRMELGWCPACKNITALLPKGQERFRCGNQDCRAELVKCRNYALEAVCNRCCIYSEEQKERHPLCDCCRFNDTIPDLTVEGHRELWGRLESAKRRLLYTLDLLRLPYGLASDGIEPALKFDFKADVTVKPRWWWSLGREERVYTGHANGKITINLREADTVEREKARVIFQEAHRTVIGHFRHEIAHYYWQMLIQAKREPEFKAAFGDHENPSYTIAQQRYYQEGPTPDWHLQFISGYATMHPWEDFAETFATYLDMVSVLDTARHMGVTDSCDPTIDDFEPMIERYIKLGVVFNELNRSMGLTDLVPEVIGPPIAIKMKYIHDLIRASTASSNDDSKTKKI